MNAGYYHSEYGMPPRPLRPGPLLALSQMGPDHAQRGRVHGARPAVQPGFPRFLRRLPEQPGFLPRPGHDEPFNPTALSTTPITASSGWATFASPPGIRSSSASITRGTRSGRRTTWAGPGRSSTRAPSPGGLEDQVTLTDKWRLIVGASWDYLDKFEGENTSRVNPLVGLKLSPAEAFDLHLSYAGKSRFPSMNSLYSPGQGNPNLESERASTFELGAAYGKGIDLKGAVFATKLYDMINSFRLPNGLRNVFQYRRGQDQRRRGPGPERLVPADGDGQLHLPRPLEHLRRPAARRPVRSQFEPSARHRPAGEPQAGGGRAVRLGVLLV